MPEHEQTPSGRRKIRVLVVDDSPFMRQVLSNMLSQAPDIQVVGAARDGIEALEKIRALRPDLVTLDVEMPRMDGLTALRTIMREMPLPVLIVSSLTREGARITLEALDLGAVDFIPKQIDSSILNIHRIQSELLAKVRYFGRRGLPRIARMPAPSPPSSPVSTAVPARSSVHPEPKGAAVRVVAIGTSTGGPRALQEILTRLPRNFPAGILIVQHMPPAFTQAFAERLNQLSPLEVAEAYSGAQIRPGRAWIAPGGKHMQVSPRGDEIQIVQDPATLHMPSADVMMASVARAFGRETLGVILTGMGQDGQEGMRRIKEAGGQTLAQDEASCVVFGMPRAAIESGVVDQVVPLAQMPAEILRRVRPKAARLPAPAPSAVGLAGRNKGVS